jgi:hypothetical protein
MAGYKLSYFNIMGRAEVSRLLFAVADEVYEDEKSISVCGISSGITELSIFNLRYLNYDDIYKWNANCCTR